LSLTISSAFEINEDTRDWLKTLDAPLGVISVAGMYRTGKSYLLNRMLLNQSRGFDVGPTINACTKVSNKQTSFFEMRLLICKNFREFGYGENQSMV
jgi:hypothetical protein